VLKTQRDPTGPSLPTVKRLFAHSGNRCAFPRCTEVLVQGSTVVGKICHIKAANPKGPRYDPQQTAAERHGYDNLLLLCGKHHTVIDDDEEAYTVERVIKMKTDHESRAARVDHDFAETAARLLIDQSVTTINQSGGITARTIHTINVHPPSVPDTAVYSVPDWPIHDLFYYLRPDINLRGPTSEFDEIGNDVLDKLSTGQLGGWGREMVRGATTTYLNLAPIDRSYWRAARFTYVFLLDGHELDIHVTQSRPSSLPDYGDLRVSRADAVKLWTHPWRERWEVTAITLVARYGRRYEPDEVTIPCQSLSLFDAEIKTEYGAGGISQQRSVSKPAFILATGIDFTLISKLTWTPQELLFDDSTTGTQKEFFLISVDSVNQPDIAKFFIHGHHP
jgi:hypothetical protein